MPPSRCFLSTRVRARKAERQKPFIVISTSLCTRTGLCFAWSSTRRPADQTFWKERSYSGLLPLHRSLYHEVGRAMLRVPRQAEELVLSITIKSILQRAHESNQTAGMHENNQIAGIDVVRSSLRMSHWAMSPLVRRLNTVRSALDTSLIFVPFWLEAMDQLSLV